jgi:hypothetical protein
MSESRMSKDPTLEERLQLLDEPFEVGQEPGLIIKMADDVRIAGNETLETADQVAGEQAIEPAPPIETDRQAGDILFPTTKESFHARWQALGEAKDEVKQVAADHSEEILGLADQLGMRHDTSLPPADIARINPEAAVWLIEGGGNLTSVVRRAIAVRAMQEVYGENLVGHVLYQFGSTERHIPRDKEGKPGEPNPEYTKAQGIAADFLPDDDTLDEFGLNVASAKQEGYVEIPQEDVSDGRVVLAKEGAPTLVMIPAAKLIYAFDALQQEVGDLTNRQLVVNTTGQYRPLKELLAQQWAEDNDVDMLPSVALGDEAGFTVEHAGKELVTKERDALVYLKEVVGLRRKSQRQSR